MDRKQFIDALFARAREAGFEACEVCVSAASSFETSVFKGEIVNYSVSDSFGLGFRGLIGGRMGYASTQILDDEAVEMLVDGAKTGASLIENDDRQFLYPGDEKYAEVDSFNLALESLTAAEKIEMARELEKKVLAQDARIAQVDGCDVISEESETQIVNTLGLNVSRRANVLGAMVGAVAREGERVNTGWGYRFSFDPKKVSLDEVAAEAAGIALSGLNAASMESGKMAVLMAPGAARDMLQTFEGVFSAESAQKGISLLKGREGERIAAECVTLMDDPFLSDSLASRPFDGEGVAAKAKAVVENGVLTTLLHNLKTAHKQGVASTGNAARSYASTVGVAPSNFYFKPGAQTQEALLERMGEGLMLTDVTGLHAGANPISGDFSLSAKGFRVRGGRKAEAVNQITVAGNFYRLLESVVAVGSDLEFGFPGGSRFGSPSLLVSELAVAGK